MPLASCQGYFTFGLASRDYVSLDPHPLVAIGEAKGNKRMGAKIKQEKI